MATLSVPASLEQLANVNAFIHETIPSSYRPLIPQVELAAEELLVNVFSYAYPDVPGEAQVACREVRLDNVPYFCFKVQDWGAPFDPFLEAPVPGRIARRGRAARGRARHPFDQVRSGPLYLCLLRTVEYHRTLFRAARVIRVLSFCLAAGMFVSGTAFGGRHPA